MKTGFLYQIIRLTLDTATGHTADDVLSGKQEDDDHRQYDDSGSSHHSFVSLAAFGHECIKSKWQCSYILGVSCDHWPQE